MSAPPVLDLKLSVPLDRFDLAVEMATTSQVTGVFGASGAGKTSLLKAIAGLKRRAQGQIRLGDRLCLDSAAGIYLPPEARDIGYVPQEGLLFPHQNVRQNLLAGAGRARRNGNAEAVSFERVCALLELEALLEREVATLSGGERQRVALGRALCSGPRLLLLDEPLAALDLPMRRRLLPYLRRLRAQLTVPMLLVSHDPTEIQALCDEVIALADGQVIARGTPREVLTDPAVFPLAQDGGFENLIPGTFHRRTDGSGFVRFAGGFELTVAHGQNAIGDQVMIGLPAHEILVATQSPQGLSARNILQATVREIRLRDRLSVITAEVASGALPLTVEVTRETPKELALEIGKAVFLIIKATSCRVYGA